jgi:hypothetical protein
MVRSGIKLRLCDFIRGTQSQLPEGIHHKLGQGKKGFGWG